MSATEIKPAARLETPAVAENAAVVRRFIASIGQLHSLSPDHLEDLKLAVSELFAATLSPTGSTVVTAVRADDSLEVRLDGARSIDPETVEFAVVFSLFPDVHYDDSSAVLKIAI